MKTFEQFLSESGIHVDPKNYYGHHGELRPASPAEKAKKAELIKHHTDMIMHHKTEMKKAEDAEDWDAHDKHEKQMKLHQGHLSNVRTYMK